ncbi:hypothetical protein CB1_000602026 [Camelus ferus]|nr:hypothetical protein CB1_000602026 [Camelus ferus]
MKTKPGVIRPVPVKSKILLTQEEEVYEPNPFSKYLEDNSDFFSEQTLPHTDCLTPGPFSHVSSFSLSDGQENSHTPFSHNVYNKDRALSSDVLSCRTVLRHFAFYLGMNLSLPVS